MRPVPALLTCVLSTALLASTAHIPRRDLGEGQLQSVRSTAERTPLGERVKLGAFVDEMHSRPGAYGAFERRLGAKTDIASYYYGFGDVFPGPIERRFADGGKRQILLGWNMGPTRFTEWSSGRHDDYLDKIAAAARDYPHLVFVRPWPEMNGDWQSFQPTADGDRPHGGTYLQFKQAWRHVVTYLDERGASNLRWVFNPDASTHDGMTPVKAIWPGKRYVDVLGLDGFNWGDDDGWGRWMSFPQIFRDQYDKLTALHPTAPVWICEVGSKEPRVDDGSPVDHSHDKGDWVRQMFDYRGMPRIKALVWFHARKERDWRINSSLSALRAFRSRT